MAIDISESRKKIDEIDDLILNLFEERMKIAGDIAEYKKENGMEVFDVTREEEKIYAIKKKAANDFNKQATEQLFRNIMAISRRYQYQLLGTDEDDI